MTIEEEMLDFDAYMTNNEDVIARCNTLEELYNEYKKSKMSITDKEKVCARCGNIIELVDNIHCKKCQSDTSESKQTE